MAWSHVGTDTALNGGADSLAVTITTVAADDILLGWVCIDSAEIINTPSGWTSRGNLEIGTANGRVAAFTKVADGTETSVTFDGWSGESIVAAVSVYRGGNTSTPVDVTGTATGSDAAPTAPDMTTTVDGCLLIGVIGAGQGDLSPMSPPTGYTERSDLKASDASFHSGGAHADKEQASAGSTGAAAFSSANSRDWGAIHIALAPASTAGITPQIHHHRFHNKAM